MSDALNSGCWVDVPLFPHNIQTHVVLCGVGNWDKCPKFLHQSWNLKPILVWSTSTLGYCISLTDWPKVDCTSMRQSVSNPIKGWCGGCELKADTLGATRGTLALDTWCPLYKRYKGGWKQTNFKRESSTCIKIVFKGRIRNCLNIQKEAKTVLSTFKTLC